MGSPFGYNNEEKNKIVYAIKDFTESKQNTQRPGEIIKDIMEAVNSGIESSMWILNIFENKDKKIL